MRTGRLSAIHDRTGFTLLEVLVVAALLVLMATVVMPSMSSMGGRGAMITTSGDLARFVSGVRRGAIDTGTRRWLRYEVNGRMVLAGPADGASDASFELPEAYEFGDHEAAERLPDIVADAATVEQKQAVWSPEVTFYPDGTGVDAQWTLKDDGGRVRTITVRGTTGRIRITSGGDDDA